MRDIKFRLWDKEEKKVIYLDRGYPYHHTFFVKEGGNIEYYNLQNGSGGIEYDIMQYTGLKDKNGKEIYEGDIVLYKHASYKDISRILYHEEVASFVMEAIKEDDNTSMARFKKGTIREFVAGRVNGYDYVKVIGNIFENPELLEEK